MEETPRRYSPGRQGNLQSRSIAKQFIIIDEARNLSHHEMKNIMSSVGEGSKIVLIGDPEQIDTPYLDYSSNGLSYVVEKFKGQVLAVHAYLIKGERSPMAQLAEDLLPQKRHLALP